MPQWRFQWLAVTAHRVRCAGGTWGDVMGQGAQLQVTRNWENSNELPGKFPALTFLLNHRDKEVLSLLQQEGLH